MISRWLARRQHARDVKTWLATLLGGYPAGTTEKLWAAYPGLADVQAERWEESAARVSVSMLTSVLPMELAQPPEQVRLSMFGEIVAVSRGEMPDLSSATRALLYVEQATRGMLDFGLVDAAARDDLMSEVLGALKGYSFSERTARRLTSLLVEDVRRPSLGPATQTDIGG